MRVVLLCCCCFALSCSLCRNMNVHLYLVCLVWFAIGSTTAYNSTSGDLLVGAFNVRIFGQKKSSRQDVMDILVKILARYDLVVVQEIRDSKETAFPTLIEQLNAQHGNLFSFFTGRRVGRSRSKEQYGFVYRNDKLDVASMYERNDQFDVFEREPLVARFNRTTVEGSQREFTFIPMHAKPKKAVEEMNSLIDVYEESVRHYGPDAVIAGDLNADCTYVCKSCWKRVKLWSDSRFLWIIDHNADTTVSKTDCAYDRIILAGEDMQRNYCCATVFRYDTEYELNEKNSKRVSDHYPVEFIIH